MPLTSHRQLSEMEQYTKIASKGKRDLKNGDQGDRQRGIRKGEPFCFKGSPAPWSPIWPFTWWAQLSFLSTKFQWWENKHPFFQLLKNKNKTVLSIRPRELILGHASFQLRCGDFCVPELHSLRDQDCGISDEAEQDPPEQTQLPGPLSQPLAFSSHPSGVALCWARFAVVGGLLCFFGALHTSDA